MNLSRRHQEVTEFGPDRQTVVLVGGPDVDARLELMQALAAEFHLAAAGSSSELQHAFANAGYDYYIYPLARRINPLADLRTIVSLTRLFRRVRPSIIHTFDTKPGVWGRLAARFAGVPVVIGTLPGLGILYATQTPSIRIVRSIYQRLQALASRVSDMTIFQNHDDARQFVEAGIVPEEKAKVIPGSGVATDVFSRSRFPEDEQRALRRELGIPSSAPVVSMVSRLLRSKGVLEFVDAARAIGAQHPDVHFLIIGPEDGQSVDKLDAEELARMKEAATWLGFREDVPAILAITDVFVLPSAYREGIPRVLLEAASMSLPIVTTNWPGCNEVVEDGFNGFLVPVRDAGALGRAIAELIENPQLCQRFGQRSRQRAIELFDLSVIAEQTHSIYWQLLECKSLSPASPE